MSVWSSVKRKIKGRLLKRWANVPDPYGHPQVTIGRHSYEITSYSVYIHRPDDLIVIGSFCSIASGVKIISSGGHFLDRVTTFPLKSKIMKSDEGPSLDIPKGGVTIGHDVWIATGAIILGPAKIGNGAVVAAGAIVRGDVPDYAIVGGVPAKLIRYRFDDETRRALQDISWWDWPDDVIQERIDDFYGDIASFISKWRR